MRFIVFKLGDYSFIPLIILWLIKLYIYLVLNLLYHLSWQLVHMFSLRVPVLIYLRYDSSGPFFLWNLCYSLLLRHVLSFFCLVGWMEVVVICDAIWRRLIRKLKMFWYI